MEGGREDPPGEQLDGLVVSGSFLQRCLKQAPGWPRQRVSLAGIDGELGSGAGGDGVQLGSLSEGTKEGSTSVKVWFLFRDV